MQINHNTINSVCKFYYKLLRENILAESAKTLKCIKINTALAVTSTVLGIAILFQRRK